MTDELWLARKRLGAILATEVEVLEKKAQGCDELLKGGKLTDAGVDHMTDLRDEYIEAANLLRTVDVEAVIQKTTPE